jgi:threonine/homoserine/homoserine lactone efflux protein
MSSFGGRVLTGGVLAVIGLITVKAMVAVASGLMALVSFMLFTVLPIALVGWLVLAAVQAARSAARTRPSNSRGRQRRGCV